MTSALGKLSEEPGNQEIHITNITLTNPLNPPTELYPEDNVLDVVGGSDEEVGVALVQKLHTRSLVIS